MTKLVPDIAGEFEDFEDWCNRASRVIADRFCPTNTVGYPIPAVCVDSIGRRCNVGGDFHRARDEKTFPVYYFWACKLET